MSVFSGSYAADDVQFLLKTISIPDTPVQEKEALIQSGKKHYSQMLSHETLPSEDYLNLFHAALALNGQRMAEQLLILAQQIINTRPNGITLVSLVRAGTPVGVLLKRILQHYFHKDAVHYSISILRDVGIDANALRFILKQHAPETLVFVDGWTGKGIIAEQLERSLKQFAVSDGVNIPAELYVLTDLSGSATVAASNEDYLIPSSVLNATVSGLVSRSIHDPELLHAHDFHACLYYQQFAEQDLSRYFIETLLTVIAEVGQHGALIPPVLNKVMLQHTSKQLVQQLMQQYAISHVNYVKPGIGEATRVLLRREARLLLLRDINAKATEHLCWLARAKAIPITIVADLPYQAVALIKEVY